ncbi:hypothetical protein Arcve_2128 [Archaeoglobus veneficus SNP6]|uniref:Uncharacterized protein n=1 Tax=Archaeoglobus veneficus (strain DSM 11195 / SNP6) TaxID=693661 RepID=F2KSP7_ARCVS|nr:hypothetical protein Arcve_2128 [Archaeoglobus veneficus SNP6]
MTNVDYEREYNEMLEKAMSKPGLAELMRLYGNINKSIRVSKRCTGRVEYYFATNSDHSF